MYGWRSLDEPRSEPAPLEPFSHDPFSRSWAGPRAPDLGERPELSLLRARSALNASQTLEGEGNYAVALAQAEEACRILEDGPEHQRLEKARCLGQLGGLHWLSGDFARAEALLLRSLAIYESGLPANDPELAALLNRLAIIYQAQGLYGRAEPLHRRALTIQQVVLGEEHADVADSLYNLAVLYKAQGLYDRARPLFERALRIRQKVLGKSDPAVAFSLASLASIDRAEGLHGEAEALLLQALRIQEAVRGPDHPDVAMTLISLAEGYQAQGLYDRAKPLFERARRIQQAALGENHPLYASTLNSLATLQREQGQLSQAESLALRALSIREAALGERHPDVAASLVDVALSRVGQGRVDDALPMLTRAFALSEERLRREALDFSESRLAGFLQYLRADEERLYALARAHPEHAGARRLALTAALLWKGRSAQETANTSRTVYRDLGPDDRDTFSQLRELRSRLARLSLDGPGPLERDQYRRQVKELAAQGDALEANLAKRSARLRALTALPAAADIVDRVAAALPADGALVEVVAYADHPILSARGALGPPAEGQLRYLALVLSPDGGLQLLDLGPAEPIDAAAGRLREALASKDARYQAAARALHGLVFRPLQPLLGAARNIFLSPDGQLSLVPFAALHDGRGFIGNTYSFTYLTSGKDLLPRPQEVAPSRSVVVMADPDYRALPGVPVASSDDRGGARLERAYSVERGAPMLRLGALSERWVPLPGSRREAEAIRRLFPRAEVYVGQEATKDRLLHLAAPGVLHLATHGFFFEDAVAPAGARGVDAVGQGGPGAMAAGADPLLRSGLVLAGALAPAARTDGEEAAPAPDRTLVTALELAGLDLWGTQLVVLSACDTGRGDVRLGQGVYGLRRALVVAGAETVVMSLWKVDDETTQALMEGYYRNLLAGQGRTAALREAMRALSRKKPHPHDWAPFISLGRDTPLQGPLGE